MNVTVRVFAGLRQLVGDSNLSVMLPDGATIGALRERLSEEYPVLESMVSTLVTAVNSDEQPPEYVLHDGDLVDVIPPISGG
jgi:molybdopterin converting factor small subunit